MSEVSRLDRATSIVVLVSAVLVAGMVTYRTFRPTATNPASKSPTPIEESAWREAVDVGIFMGGSREAPVTIVELTDLECPACRGYQATLDEVVARHRNQVRLLYVPHPLSYHRFAPAAAKAATCAADLGALPSWIRTVYAGQDSLGMKSWGRFALEAGIADTSRIASCALDPAPSTEIETGLRLGNSIGLVGTPTIVIEGIAYYDPPTKVDLETAIERATATRAATPPTFTMTGMIIDSASGAPIRGVVVELLSPTGDSKQATTTNEGGQFTLQAPNGRYRLRAVKDGYRTESGSRAAELRPPLNPMIINLSRQGAR